MNGERRSRGLLVCGAALIALLTPASAQQGQSPPRRGEAFVPQPPAQRAQPGTYVDPATGALVEVFAPVEPVYIPPGGMLPHGTLPDPQREAGRPMRPGVTPWIPDGTGYWPPAVRDQAGDITTSLPLMQDFEGPGYNGLTPPDPDLARGYDYQVCVTNDDFAVYDSSGNEVFYSDINDFTGDPWFLYDCKVIFDPWGQRWVMMYHLKETDPQDSKLYILVTEDSLPFGLTGSWWYRFPMLQDGGTGNASWCDYFDLGYSSTQLFASGNMFKYTNEFRWARIRVFNKAEVYAGVGATSLSFSDLRNNDGSQTDSPRSAKMQAGWSESGLNVDGVFINSRWGGGSKLTLWKLRDAFGANTLTRVDIPVGNYTPPPDATQPTGEKLDTIDSRLMPAVIGHDRYGDNGIELFTGMTTDYEGRAACMLYKLDAPGNALEWERVFFSTGWDYWFPSPAADYSGSSYWVFSRTQFASGGEPEIRFVDMNKGEFSNSSTQVLDGTGSYNGFRWGDYFGGELDWGDYSANYDLPGRPSKVWLYGEYGKPDSWGTHAGASSVFAQGDLTDVVPASTYVITGPVGGPFTPASREYTLESAAGDTGVAFEVTSLPAWLDASAAYGQLWTDRAVTLSVNSDADSMHAGTYNDNVYFIDRFNGGNSFTRAVQLVVLGGPDLEVLSIDAEDGAYHPTDTLMVTGVYRNNGDQPTGNFSADFYASENTFISELDHLLGTRSYASLGAGATMSFGPHYFSMPCLPEGPYYIGVIATVAGDGDTTNNTNYDPTPIDGEYCPGDFDQNCSVDTRDVLAFLNAWSSGDMRADCDGNHAIDSRDVLCFLNLWTGGC